MNKVFKCPPEPHGKVSGALVVPLPAPVPLLQL